MFVIRAVALFLAHFSPEIIVVYQVELTVLDGMSHFSISDEQTHSSGNFRIWQHDLKRSRQRVGCA